MRLPFRLQSSDDVQIAADDLMLPQKYLSKVFIESFSPSSSPDCPRLKSQRDTAKWLLVRSSSSKALFARLRFAADSTNLHLNVENSERKVCTRSTIGVRIKHFSAIQPIVR